MLVSIFTFLDEAVIEISMHFLDYGKDIEKSEIQERHTC